jgi:D-galactarolactone cycloisomerase
MRIEKIETYKLIAPIEPSFGWSQGWAEKRHLLLVKITGDDGTVGWGETLGVPSQSVLHEILAPLVIGQDPMNRSGIWERMFQRSGFYLSNSAVGLGACGMSGIDIALWDLAGKAAGIPVCEMLGGRVREQVAVYATGLYYTENETHETLCKEAVGYVEAGFKGMKTKVGRLSVNQDVERVAAIRKAIGSDIHLMIDANQAYNVSSAMRIARKLSDYDIFWFEEPVNTQDLDSYLFLKSALPMPLAGGETLKTRYEFEKFLSRKAYDHVQPDVAICGGLTDMQRICHMANMCGIQVNPHVWGSQISIAATVHLTSTLPPCPQAFYTVPYIQDPVFELDRTPNPIRDTICSNPFQPENGLITVSKDPGLGIEILEKEVKKLCVEGGYTVCSQKA